MWKVSYAKRMFDQKPLACHLYVTDQCNLDCHYCTEYDNSVPHPDVSDLKRWCSKARDLGCLHIGLQGGEPLLHPDIVEVVRHCKALGFSISLSTNGFLLDKDLVRDLDDAGLDTLQVSVDLMNPTESTRKSLKTIIPKLEFLAQCRFDVQMAGVLFADTLPECEEVLEFGLSKGYPTHFRMVHPDPKSQFRVPTGRKEDIARFVSDMIDRKVRGQKIHSNWTILDYQVRLLNNDPLDWTCTAGFKYFFISAKGKFWLCSMVHSDVDIMDVTPKLLQSYYHKKECQSSCGVYCVVTTSLAYEQPIRFLLREMGIGRKRWAKKVRFAEEAEEMLQIEEPFVESRLEV